MSLSDYLGRVYAGHFRIDRVGGVRTIQVDHRRPIDVHRYYCTIWAEIRPDDTLTLRLEYPPFNDQVGDVVNSLGGRVSACALQMITIDLPATDDAAGAVRDLAAAIRGVTRRGQRYGVRDWVWMAPRTASSLNVLARHLTRYYRTSRRRT